MKLVHLAGRLGVFTSGNGSPTRRWPAASGGQHLRAFLRSPERRVLSITRPKPGSCLPARPRLP